MLANFCSRVHFSATPGKLERESDHHVQECGVLLCRFSLTCLKVVGLFFSTLKCAIQAGPYPAQAFLFVLQKR